MLRALLLLTLLPLLTGCASFGVNRPVKVERSREKSTDTGVRYVDKVVGEGPVVLPETRVRVHYVGTLSGGEPFDSSYDTGRPLEFTVGAGEVVVGWEEGMIGMRPGGVRRIVIPPERGYGAEGKGPIPPNATVTLQVELLEIVAPGNQE